MIIKAKNISKKYDKRNRGTVVLDKINFIIKENEIISVMGPSGSGKTTLLNILGLIITPDEGTILFDGKDITKYDTCILRREKIGFLFQNHYLIPQLTIYDNLLLPFYSDNHKFDKNWDKHITEILIYFDIEKIKYAYPNEISAGEKQRIAFIRAIIRKPKIVFADEPTGNLDKDNTNKLINLIHTFKADHNTSFVIATHDKLITKNSDRMIYIDRGKLSTTVYK